MAYRLRHSIATITFPPRQEVGPCSCICGWTGITTEWPSHFISGRKHKRWVRDAGTPEFNRTLNPVAQGQRAEETAA